MAQEEKLEEAKRLYETANADQRYMLESLFPELKKSENEKMRKDCIKYLDWEYQHCSINEDKMKIEKCIAWLEKQGTVIKDAISMDVYYETEWDDIHKFLRKNLNGEKVKLVIIKE